MKSLTSTTVCHKPAQKPRVYDTNDKAVFALKSKQIDGLVVDLPTAFYVTAVQVPNGKILGQFPSGRVDEHFGMVFQKGNSLARCVDRALAVLKRNGSLAKIQQQWMSQRPDAAAGNVDVVHSTGYTSPALDKSRLVVSNATSVRISGHATRSARLDSGDTRLALSVAEASIVRPR